MLNMLCVYTSENVPGDDSQCYSYCDEEPSSRPLFCSEHRICVHGWQGVISLILKICTMYTAVDMYYYIITIIEFN